MGARDPDDREKPYSRPVPRGIRTPPYERPSPTWSDPQELLDKAKERVKEAKEHKGVIATGVPGYRKSGNLTPNSVIPDKSRKCTEYVYNLSIIYFYVNDRTLILEEQLSPSHEFFIANGVKKIDITKKETGWSVSPSVSAGVGPLDVSISGSYWQTTQRITGTEKSSLEGRTLWLFHIGRLYLCRRAYVKINFEYHYEVCNDGTTRNWVNITYFDHWVYWYEWEEEVFAASKDDEGNFHREESFPSSRHSETLEKNSDSYEVESLDQEEFEDCGPFFPKVTNK